MRLHRRFALESSSPLLHPVFSPDGKQIATLDGAGNLTLWDFETLKPIAQTRCEASPHYLIQGFGLEWSSGGLIAAPCAVGILLYDAGLKLHSRWQSRPHTKFALMAGGKWLARADSDKSPGHPHGIKVRLVSGAVGRVKQVLD